MACPGAQIKSLTDCKSDLERQLHQALQQGAELRRQTRAVQARWLSAEADKAVLQQQNAALTAHQVGWGCSQQSPFTSESLTGTNGGFA